MGVLPNAISDWLNLEAIIKPNQEVSGGIVAEFLDEDGVWRPIYGNAEILPPTPKK